MTKSLETDLSPVPGEDSPRNSLVIASRNLPSYYGGLSQYQRELASYLLRKLGVSGTFIAENLTSTDAMPALQKSGWKHTVLDEKETWQKGREFCLRCASRPYLNWLVEKVVVARWSKEIEKALPVGVEAIHFVGTGWDFLGFALLSVARKKGLRFTILPAVHPEDWGDDIIDLRLYQAADTVFALGDHEKQWLVNKGLPAEKIARSGLPPMCLDTGDAASFRSRYNLKNRSLVLFMGRRDEGKGYPALLEAWKGVHAQFPNACLITIGPQASPNENPIGEEHEGVLDLGKVSEQEKADALAACDIFCLPSAHESFGIVYLEAWSYAKPVICGTAPACRELIENHVEGLWSSQDIKQLEADIGFLLTNPTLAVEMGARGKKKQVEGFTWEKIGQIHYQEFFPA